MCGPNEPSWSSLVSSSIRAVVISAFSATYWWLHISRSNTVAGHSAKKIKVYHTPTFPSARVAWMIAGKTHLCQQCFSL